MQKKLIKIYIGLIQQKHFFVVYHMYIVYHISYQRNTEEVVEHTMYIIRHSDVV